jgi:transcriptional antiterminator RfaH
MIDNTYKWYPICTRSRAEKKVFLALEKKQIAAYLPLRKEVKQWSDRKKTIDVPLFNAYLFVFISSKEYTEVLMVNGVTRFIYFCGKIASIPAKQIDDLKLLLALDSDLELIEHAIKPGQKVLIKAGPFMGVIAELVLIANKKNIILRLDNLGYSIQIKTSMAYIEPI